MMAVQDTRQARDLTAPAPYMFAVDIGPEHLTQFHIACAAGAATVVCFGDSIFSQQAELIAPTESPWFTLIQQLRAHNPGVALTEHNYAIAAYSFLEMESALPLSNRPHWWYSDPDATWISYVAAAEPDLVFVYSGGNDGYDFSAVAFSSLIRQLKALPKPPSIVFGLTYLPSVNSLVNDYHLKRTQDGVQFVTGWLRGFCKRNGYGFLDFMRWHNRCRDGFDSTEITCTLVDPAPGTMLPCYPTAPIFADESGRISFPGNQNDNGTPANCVTDFYVNFTLLQSLEKTFTISLSDSRRNESRPVDSAVCLRQNDGRFEYWWSDGLNDFIDHKISETAVPHGPLNLSIAVKNELVTISYVPSSAVTATRPGLEFGKITICELNVVRFGAPFHPVFSGLGASGAIIINNLCIANRVMLTRNVAQYQPTVTNDEIYARLANAGGSGAYHMNAYGVQKIMNPVIKAANFRPPATRSASNKLRLPVLTGSRTTEKEAILESMIHFLEQAGLLVDKTTS